MAVEQPAGAPEIHVIPEEYYGAALKAKFKAKQVSTAAGAPAPKSKLPIVIAVVILFGLMGGGGYFVYTNQELIFGKKTEPAPPVVVAPQPTTTKPVPPPPPPPPSAPANLSVTSTAPQSVSLNWTDTANNEAAYRLERRTADRTIYERVTDLPANSTSFQDNSVQASTTYFYRVIARNDTGDSDPSNESEVVTRSLPPPPPVQPKQEPLPPAGLDTDSDGLSDLEETLLSSNPRNPDSDGDGFLDGNEVFNLYNPVGKAPAKLSGSDLVKEVYGTIGWNMLIPKDWNLTLDATDGSAATVDTGHGEKFTVSIEKNDNNLPVVDWFMALNPDTDKTRLMQFKSKGGYEGLIGTDLLTTYIPWGKYIFVFKYDMGKQPFINYRTVYSMMLNSLVLKGLPQEVVPAGTGQLPFEPGATQPGSMTQPVAITAATPTVPALEVFPTPGIPPAPGGIQTQPAFPPAATSTP